MWVSEHEQMSVNCEHMKHELWIDECELWTCECEKWMGERELNGTFLNILSMIEGIFSNGYQWHEGICKIYFSTSSAYPRGCATWIHLTTN